MACFMCVLAIALGLFGIIAYLWYNKPSVIIRLSARLMLFWTGCKVKHVEVAGMNWCYAERGAPVGGKPTMLFVHPFLLRKESWIPVLKRLPDYHVILVDMPGHGDSGVPPEDADLSISGMAQLLHKFVLLTGLNRQPLHVIGLSLGGAIVGEYAAKFPADVAQVTLMTPAMNTPTMTALMLKARKTGKFPALSDTLDGFLEAMQSASVTPAPQNEQLVQGLLEMRRTRDAFYNKMYDAVDRNLLEAVAPDIKAPTQVIWGKQDKMVNVTGADLLKEKLPNCQQCDILDNCGHMIIMDQPDNLTNCLIVFRQVAS